MFRDRPASRAARAKFAIAFAKTANRQNAIWRKVFSLCLAMHGQGDCIEAYRAMLGGEALAGAMAP